MSSYHLPVMKDECLKFLDVKPDGVYLDCTAGGGGHSSAILEKLSQKGRLVAFDKDQDAITECERRFSGDCRVTLVKSDFKAAPEWLKENNLYGKLDGVIIDLGVSSKQLDDRSRGFSYLGGDDELDMRMDRAQTLTAKQIVNEYDKQEIFEIIKKYGEDKFAANIAKNIEEYRKTRPIETTGQLAEIVDKSIPFAFKKTGGHPAKRTFQALRIAVNGELDNLDMALTELVRSLKVGGNMVVLTFHSLEDRIAKQTFAYLETDCVCDKSVPVCTCGKVSEVKYLTKFEVASEKEKIDNPRSISAKLRAVQKI